MEGQAVFELGDVVVSALACIVGGMDANAQIGTNHDHAHVKSQTQTSAHSQLVEEFLHSQLAALALGVILEQPHIASVEKYGSVQVAQYREAVLPVVFKFESASLVIVAEIVFL